MPVNKMKGYFEIDKKKFLKKLAIISEKFYDELDRHITEPDDDSIHDIRVSIRRLESAYNILPKDVRKQEEIKKYMKQIKALFKSNAKIRDFDIISASMESRHPDKTADLILSLKNSKREQLKNANRLASEIFRLHIPKISKFNIKKSRLNKRYLKVLDETLLSIQKNMIIALDDEKRIDELHALRKDFKKLRYSLELASCKKTTSRILENLKNFQDILGEIHDSDIIIEYLRSATQNSKYSDIIKTEIVERSKKYRTFVSTMKKSSGTILEL